MRKILMSMLAILFLCNCGSKTESDNPQRELSNLVIGSGSRAHELKVEVAVKDEEMRKGLMFRKEMPENQGMIFIITPPRAISMWMKNTYIPLDMIFINSDNQISGIIEKTKPLSEEFIYSPKNTKAVLELNSGMIKKLKIRKGDIIKHKLLDNE